MLTHECDQCLPAGRPTITAPPGSILTIPEGGSVFIGTPGPLSCSIEGHYSLPPCPRNAPHVLVMPATIAPPASGHLTMCGVRIGGSIELELGTVIVIPFSPAEPV